MYKKENDEKTEYIRTEESKSIVKICNWGEYSKVLVNGLGLVDENDKNKILNISSGSDTMQFKVDKDGYETRIDFSYDVSLVTENIYIYYTKNTIIQ
jgi:hypothetical protein